MDAEFQLFFIEATDRAGVVTSISAALSGRGVNIDCFATTRFEDHPDGRRGNFVVIVEADNAYARVLARVLMCLEVVYDVRDPIPLDAGELSKWRAKFSAIAPDS
jgi:acetolactate synthase small subunit